MRARGVRLLGWLGRLACLVVLAVLVAALADVASGAGGLPAGHFVVTAVAVLGAVVVWWRWAGTAPTRLDVARAAEAIHPGVGERLSRAIEFLDDPAAPRGERDMTLGLRRVAATDAAAAAAAMSRLPAPGCAFHLPWAAAGAAAVAMLVASILLLPGSWGLAVRRQVPWGAGADRPVAAVPGRERSGPAGDVPQAASADTAPIAAAIAELSAASVLESRLAGLLAARFAVAPGRPVFTLPDDMRRDLPTLAAIHAEAVGTARRVRDILETIDVPAARPAAGRLTALLRADDERVTDAITTNRLALAADGAGRFAAGLVETVVALGGPHPGTTLDAARLEPRMAAVTRRAELALADIAEKMGGRAAVPDQASTTERIPAGVRPSSSRAGGPAPAPIERSQVNDLATTPEPGFVAGGAETMRPDDERLPAVIRVWGLLPSTNRSFSTVGSAADAPPAYAAAIDLYYNLLLESLVAERVERREQ